METATDIVGNEEAKAEDNVDLLEKTADPVVYQLVRVDGNGRLVPATNDEVMVVENLLENDKSEGKLVIDGQILECNTNHECGSSTVQLKESEGLPQLGDLEVNKEKLNEPYHTAGDAEKVRQRHKSVSSSDESGSSTSAVGIGSKPNFSLLKGEICLENLSVRELQETFKATFGRDTCVKDKQWLKRRIVMGLTNSCDFSTTTFVIVDNKVVKKEKKETLDHSVLIDCVVKSETENRKIPPPCDDKINYSIIQDNLGSKDSDSEHRPAKRVRKPTKRYIEELSDVESREECGAKLVSPIKHLAFDQPIAKAFVRDDQNFVLDRSRLTRQDSLGGSGVQVPYVSRIRRSRPRENFMTLTKLQPCGLGMPNRLVKNNDIASSERRDNGNVNKALEVEFSNNWVQELPAVAVSERCEPYTTERKTIHLENEIVPKNTDSYKNDSDDDDVATIPTSNGGMRRKHHRPWTLAEVVKLVEGVAKYGAGRWSEIKRLVFASYTYRTSVDLKDKWRNLLRASLAELPDRNEIQNSRKQGSILLPASILSRVRELADIQKHAPTSHNSSKLAGYAEFERSMHETKSGFL